MEVETDVIKLGSRYYFEDTDKTPEQIQKELDYGKGFELFQYGGLTVDDDGQPADELTKGFFERYGLRYNVEDQRIEATGVDQEEYKREVERLQQSYIEEDRADAKPELWKQFMRLVVQLDEVSMDRIADGMAQYAADDAGAQNNPWLYGKLITHAVGLAVQETGVKAPSTPEQ